MTSTTDAYNDRNIVTVEFDWQGISLSVSYEADWLGCSRAAGRDLAHLEIRSIKPQGNPLPVTATGYLSHFLHPDEIELAGGPAAYVLEWLEQAAEKPAWRKIQEATRQLSLF